MKRIIFFLFCAAAVFSCAKTKTESEQRDWYPDNPPEDSSFESYYWPGPLKSYSTRKEIYLYLLGCYDAVNAYGITYEGQVSEDECLGVLLDKDVPVRISLEPREWEAFKVSHDEILLTEYYKSGDSIVDVKARTYESPGKDRKKQIIEIQGDLRYVVYDFDRKSEPVTLRLIAEVEEKFYVLTFEKIAEAKNVDWSDVPVN